MVKSPSPKLSKINNGVSNFFSKTFTSIAKILAKKTTVQLNISFIQKTGTSSSKSRKVPPPKEVTKDTISTPKGSNLFSIAAKAPDIEKETNPKSSITKLKFSYNINQHFIFKTITTQNESVWQKSSFYDRPSSYTLTASGTNKV